MEKEILAFLVISVLVYFVHMNEKAWQVHIPPAL